MVSAEEHDYVSQIISLTEFFTVAIQDKEHFASRHKIDFTAA
jgi:hypothetical protein